jgi:aminoglycoside phosphotransferase (APT) family kinase protein
MHAIAAATALAQLHRLALDDCPPLPTLDAQHIDALCRDYAAAWQMRRAALHGLYPEFTALGERLVDRLGELLAPLSAHAALLHGDAHAENLPARRSGGIAMLDWQNPCLGNPGSDLADLLVMSYPVARRRAVEASLIDRHATLLAWPHYQRWAAYRAGVLHRLVRVVRIAAQSPDWPSLSWVFRRCAAAALDAVALDAAALDAAARDAL